MDSIHWLSLLQEFAFLIATFVFFITLGLWRGMYTLIKVIISMYLALLLFIYFPFTDSLPDSRYTKLVLFFLLTSANMFLLRRHIPSDSYEKMFEYLGKKITLSVLATIVLLVISYNFLDLAELVNARSTFDNLFTTQVDLFWWLLVPLFILTVF